MAGLGTYRAVLAWNNARSGYVKGPDEAPEHRVVAPDHVVIQIARDARIQPRGRQAAGGLGALGRELWGWEGAKGKGRVRIED
jgi:hypothetical protein